MLFGLGLGLIAGGAVALLIGITVVLANGTLITNDIINTTVDGTEGTNIWNPQQVLTVNVAHATAPPETIKVATENGKDVTFNVA